MTHFKLHIGGRAVMWVTQHRVIDPSFSVGGAKPSGLGRALGRAGLLEFVPQHTICVAA